MFNHPTQKSPKRVCIVALGPSHRSFIHDRLAKGNDRPEWNEIWTVNRGARCFPHDVVFVMDDLRGEHQGDPAYGDFLMGHDRPIITSREYPEFAGAVEYPLGEVVAHVGSQAVYFHNSLPYMIAYASWIGVLELTIFGADYSMPDGRTIENDRANSEYWIGWARAKFMRVGVPTETTLLNMKQHQTTWLYGYADQVAALDVVTRATKSSVKIPTLHSAQREAK